MKTEHLLIAAAAVAAIVMYFDAKQARADADRARQAAVAADNRQTSVKDLAIGASAATVGWAYDKIFD